MWVETQKQLATALDEYRLARCETDFGLACTFNLGPGLVLPDDVLARLVSCAHAKKIKIVDDISRETKWAQVDTYGKQVLDIIMKYVS